MKDYDALSKAIEFLEADLESHEGIVEDENLQELQDTIVQLKRVRNIIPLSRETTDFPGPY